MELQSSQSRKPRMAAAVSLAWESRAKWPVSQKRTLAVRFTNGVRVPVGRNIAEQPGNGTLTLTSILKRTT
jgi:hypothetical protein